MITHMGPETHTGRPAVGYVYCSAHMEVGLTVGSLQVRSSLVLQSFSKLGHTELKLVYRYRTPSKRLYICQRLMSKNDWMQCLTVECAIDWIVEGTLEIHLPLYTVLTGTEDTGPPANGRPPWAVIKSPRSHNNQYTFIFLHTSSLYVTQVSSQIHGH